ncbi:Meiotic nuclear division protein 1, variant 2 [Bonamia ostreae]
MSVKEVLKSLVDDSKIDSDKIGIGTYYWAFKGKAFQAEKTRNENIIKNIEQLNETEKRLKNDLVHLKNDRNGEKRSENLKKLKRENQIVNDLEKEHDFLVQNDPIVLENQKQKLKQLVEGINRWTDNVYTLLKHIKDKRPDISEEQVFKYFEIPSDFDYVEL